VECKAVKNLKEKQIITFIIKRQRAALQRAHFHKKSSLLYKFRPLPGVLFGFWPK